ncbi:hypothetical protein QZH41_013461, partial [Actinostola sp. cb2023]
CAKACEMISKSLDECRTSCANSTICKTSCQYITTVKAWANVYNGEGSTIPKPPVAKATTKNLTSLTLSWQPGVLNVSGSVVYLLKKKYSQGDNEGNDKLT